MREIKFRIYDTTNKKFVEAKHWFVNLDFSTIHFNDGFIFIGPTKSIGQYYILQQYTGIKDGKGKEIYEGDIIQYDERVCSERGEFEDYTESRKVVVKWSGTGWKTPGITFPSSVQWPTTKWEIIGNILENPEVKLGSDRIRDEFNDDDSI